MGFGGFLDSRWLGVDVSWAFGGEDWLLRFMVDMKNIIVKVGERKSLLISAVKATRSGGIISTLLQFPTVCLDYPHKHLSRAFEIFPVKEYHK